MIKGNAGEIGALSNSSEVSKATSTNTPTHSLTVFRSHDVKVRSKGVDSTGSGFTDPASIVQSLALRERECAINA